MDIWAGTVHEIHEDYIEIFKLDEFQDIPKKFVRKMTFKEKVCWIIENEADWFKRELKLNSAKIERTEEKYIEMANMMQIYHANQTRIIQLQPDIDVKVLNLNKRVMRLEKKGFIRNFISRIKRGVKK